MAFNAFKHPWYEIIYELQQNKQNHLGIVYIKNLTSKGVKVVQSKIFMTKLKGHLHLLIPSQE